MSGPLPNVIVKRGQERRARVGYLSQTVRELTAISPGTRLPYSGDRRAIPVGPKRTSGRDHLESQELSVVWGRPLHGTA
jgi:hypothetical protein